MQTFLHSNCRRGMCDDCINIAEEYQELEHNRKMALMRANNDLEEMSKILETVRREAEMYKSVAHAGIGDIISAWMDKEINSLLNKKEKRDESV